MIDIKYKNIYDKFIEHYKNVHVNPWHEINEKQLDNLYNNLIRAMDINDDYTFKYFMDYIIKRLSGKSDAHTKYESVSLIPMNFKMFDNEIIVNYPNDLKNSKLISINGISIDIITSELEEIITYGTSGRRKYEIEKSLFNKYILFVLLSLKKFNELIFELEQVDGKKIIRKFYKDEKYSKEELSKEELFDYNKYLFGENVTYSFVDNCLIYNHSSVQAIFKNQKETAIAN